MSTSDPHPLRVFLCHAHGDKPAVRDLYTRLQADGVQPWLDEEDLLPGQDWQLEIPKAVRASDVFLVCLSSRSVNKAGYVQKEIRLALDTAEEQPEGTIFIIPARLEDCTVPDRLSRYHWVNLYDERGYGRLLRALANRAQAIGVAPPARHVTPPSPALPPAEPNVPPAPAASIDRSEVDSATPQGKPEESKSGAGQSQPLRQWMIIALALLFVGGGFWLFNRLGGGQAQGPIPTATRPLPSPTTAAAVAPKATEASRVATPTTAPAAAAPTQAPAGKVTSAVTANAQWTPRVQSFDGVDMVLAPPGCFMMGTADPPSGSEDERPATRICFEQPFWIDKTEVTQAQFRRVGGKAANSPGFPGDNRPVERITWFEARDFCAKRGARLPTEAEWEYAARGPDNLIYPWGNTFDGSKGVYIQNSGDQTADVGSRPTGASWVGALDMSGNVWEWVSSLYKSYPYLADDGRENLEGAGSRALRGGSWLSLESYLRAASRDYYLPAFEFFSIGFRCARSS